jgi:type II secretory pathway component PulK
MSKKSASNRRRRASPQHRRSARYRAANRLRILATVLGYLSLVIAALFTALAAFGKEPFPTGQWLVAIGYLGGGLFCLLLRFLFRRSSPVRRPEPPQPRIPPRIDPNKTGMALILTLVLLGVLSTLLLHLQATARAARRIDQQLWQETRLQWALTDEAFHRIQEIADKPDQQIDHLDETWNQMREKVRPDGIVTLSQVTDLNRFFDLNNLVLDQFAGPNITENVLIEALTHAGDFTPLERIEALRDWIDADTEGARETTFYREQDPAYTTPDTWLHSWRELLWIDGFDPAYFERKPVYQPHRPFQANVVDLVSIVPGPRNQPVPVNINTATPELLESLTGPGRESIARYILLARSERPFLSIDALISRLDPALFAGLRPFITVRSSHFLVEVQAFDQSDRRRLRAIAQRASDHSLRIVQWLIQ